MKELILYFIIFIISYMFYFIFVLNRKSVLNKFPNGKEMTYLKYRYGIKVDNKSIKKIANKVFLANSFIFATAVYIMCLFENLIIQILVGIIVVIVLILVLYHMIGIYYKKKQGGK